MTIEYLDSKRLSGLSTDIKPRNIQANSIFVETDTGSRLWFPGSHDSMYEYFQALTSVQTSHFVEWFSGSGLSTIWTTGGSGGSSSMSDAIDGGLAIATSTTNNSTQYIHFNDKRHYDYQDSVVIAVQKISTSPASFITGLIRSASGISNALLAAGVDLMGIGRGETGNYAIYTADGSTQSGTTSSVASDTEYHTFKGVMGSSNNLFYLDGVLEVTKTTNLCSTDGLQPFSAIRTGTTAVKTLNISFLECYNTSVSINSSLYEILSELTQVTGQRVVEQFQGNNIDTTRWTTTGIGTATTKDEINGGVEIASSNTATSVAFNSKRQYDNSNSVFISVFKRNTSGQGITHVGLVDTANTLGGNYSIAEDATNQTYKRLQTRDNSTTSSTNSTIAVDLAYHVYKVDLSASDNKLYIDGVLEVTKTTNLPTGKLMPELGTDRSAVGVANGMQTTYFEAYNKLAISSWYNSVYEMFNPLTTVAKSHFWEWFDGNNIDTTRWTQTLVGSSSGAMNDAVDGGFQITSGAVSGNRAEYDFNNKRQHDYQNSEFICVMKANSTSSIFIRCGFLDDVLASFANGAYWRFDTNTSIYYNLATQGSATDSDVTADTNYHSFKGTVTSSDFKGYIDGVLKVTISTNLPTAKYQPHIDVGTRTSSAKTGNFTYFEAYNT